MVSRGYFRKYQKTYAQARTSGGRKICVERRAARERHREPSGTQKTGSCPVFLCGCSCIQTLLLNTDSAAALTDHSYIFRFVPGYVWGSSGQAQERFVPCAMIAQNEVTPQVPEVTGASASALFRFLVSSPTAAARLRGGGGQAKQKSGSCH